MLEVAVKVLLANLILALMLSTGLAARPRDLADIVRRPRLYVRILLVIELAIPVLAIVVVAAIPVSPIAAALIVILAICPGAPFIPAATKGRGASYSVLGLDILVLTALLAPLTIPLWVAIVERSLGLELQITVGAVLVRVLAVVIVPLLIGFAIRLLLPRAADVLAKILHYVFLVALAGSLVVGLILGAPVFLRVSPFALLAALVLVVGSAALGSWAATSAADRRTTAVAAALGNPGLALAVIAASYPGFHAAAFVAAYLVLRKLALIPIEHWIAHRARPRAPAHGAAQPAGA